MLILAGDELKLIAEKCGIPGYKEMSRKQLEVLFSTKKVLKQYI